MERVECRIGPDPVKGWAAGRIIALNYSVEKNIYNNKLIKKK